MPRKQQLPLAQVAEDQTAQWDRVSLKLARKLLPVVSMEEGEQLRRRNAPTTDSRRRLHRIAAVATRTGKVEEDDEEEKVTPMMGTIRAAVVVKTIELATGGGTELGGKWQMR